MLHYGAPGAMGRLHILDWDSSIGAQIARSSLQVCIGRYREKVVVGSCTQRHGDTAAQVVRLGCLCLLWMLGIVVADGCLS